MLVKRLGSREERTTSVLARRIEIVHPSFESGSLLWDQQALMN